MRTITLIGAVLLAAAGAAQADIQSDVDSILSGGGYQRSLPEFEQKEIEIPNQVQEDGASNTDINPVLEFLFWMLAAVGAVLLAYALYRAAANTLDKRSRTRRLPAAGNVPAAGPEGATPPNAFDEIERLAGAGAFGEAVRLLLLKCFVELHRSHPATHDSALTSRELLARTTLPTPVRDGLAFIVSAVELGHFGGRQINRTTYERCMDGYRDIMANRSS